MSSSLTSPPSSSSPSITGAPLSISTKFVTLRFVLIFILAVQTSFSSSPSTTKTLYKKSTATKHLTDADRESLSSLIAQWKENNAGTDKDQTSSSSSSSGVSSAISTLYNDFKTIKGAGVEIFQEMLPKGLESKLSEIHSDGLTEGEYAYDTVDHDYAQPEADVVPVTHVEPHEHHEHYEPHGHSVLKPVVKEVAPYTFWDWLHSDGVSTAVTLFLFGVLPILIGLIPFIVIASNFWFIFNKIHALHALFLGLGSHDDYGWSSGWPSSGWPSSLPSSGYGWGEYSLNH